MSKEKPTRKRSESSAPAHALLFSLEGLRRTPAANSCPVGMLGKPARRSRSSARVATARRYSSTLHSSGRLISFIAIQDSERGREGERGGGRGRPLLVRGQVRVGVLGGRDRGPAGRRPGGLSGAAAAWARRSLVPARRRCRCACSLVGCGCSRSLAASADCAVTLSAGLRKVPPCFPPPSHRVRT